jgi:gliding motility-associated-like protein
VVNAGINPNGPPWFCPGGSILLTGNGGNQYQWSNGSSSQSINVSSAGTYVLTASNSGCTDSASITVSVNNSFSTQIASAPSGNICQGDSVLLVVSGASLLAQQWYLNNVLLTGKTDDSIYAQAGGNYSVSVNASGNCFDTSSVQINVLAIPTADFTYNQPLCSSQIQFTNASTGANNYLWTFNSGATSNQINSIQNFPVSGNYNIMLVAMNNSCNDTIIKNISVNPVVHADFTNDTLCALSKQFSNQTSNGFQFTWNFGDGTTTNAVSPVHLFSQTGSYNVQLLSQDANGCRDSITKNVLISLYNPSAFTYNLDTCAGTMSFLPYSLFAQEYLWDFGDQKQSSSNITTHHYAQDGIYFVSLTTNPSLLCAEKTTEQVFIPSRQYDYLYIPNSFTPNGDGINDYFTIYGEGKCLKSELYIYNRWGEIVYETKDITIFWDGKCQGQKVPEGVYCFLLIENGVHRTGMVYVGL